MNLTVERLRSVLKYEHETGVFSWRVDVPQRGIKVGDAAGDFRKDGYLRVGVDGRRYRAARLAWFYVIGEWPISTIDHKDRNRSNNAWTNLREATESEQKQNTGKPKNNTSGFKGVTWCSRTGKWQAQLQKHRRNVHLGRHTSLLDAVAARIRGERRLFTHSERC